MSLRKLPAALLEHPVARPILQYGVDNDQSTIILDDIDGMHSASRKNRVLKALRSVFEQADIGRVVIGRRGGRTRVELTVSIGELRRYLAEEPAANPRTTPRRRGRRSVLADELSDGLDDVAAEAGFEPDAEPAPALTVVPAGNDAPTPADDAVSNDETFTHRFHLRRGFEVSLTLPIDLSLREARRLRAWLLALPLDEAHEADFFFAPDHDLE